jgi:hypothetical protein
VLKRKEILLYKVKENWLVWMCDWWHIKEKGKKEIIIVWLDELRK